MPTEGKISPSQSFADPMCMSRVSDSICVPVCLCVRACLRILGVRSVGSVPAPPSEVGPSVYSSETRFKPSGCLCRGLRPQGYLRCIPGIRIFEESDADASEVSDASAGPLYASAVWTTSTARLGREKQHAGLTKPVGGRPVMAQALCPVVGNESQTDPGPSQVCHASCRSLSLMSFTDVFHCGLSVGAAFPPGQNMPLEATRTPAINEDRRQQCMTPESPPRVGPFCEVGSTRVRNPADGLPPRSRATATGRLSAGAAIPMPPATAPATGVPRPRTVRGQKVGGMVRGTTRTRRGAAPPRLRLPTARPRPRGDALLGNRASSPAAVTPPPAPRPARPCPDHPPGPEPRSPPHGRAGRAAARTLHPRRRFCRRRGRATDPPPSSWAGAAGASESSSSSPGARQFSAR